MLGSQWRSEVQTNPRAGSKGCGLLCPTLDPDLALFVPGQDRTGPRVGQTGRISGTKKDLRGPLTRDHYGGWWCETRARTRVFTRSLSVKNPGPVLRGTLPHAIRREFPTPHPISEFSSRTDESASSPGISSCAKREAAGRPRRWLVVSSTHRAEVWCIVRNDALSKAIFGLRVAKQGLFATFATP